MKIIIFTLIFICLQIILPVSSMIRHDCSNQKVGGHGYIAYPTSRCRRFFKWLLLKLDCLLIVNTQYSIVYLVYGNRVVVWEVHQVEPQAC